MNLILCLHSNAQSIPTQISGYITKVNDSITYRTGANSIRPANVGNRYIDLANIVKNLRDSALLTNGTVTSVGIAVPSAYSVSGTPITSSGTLTIVATGASTQYVRGDGALANFPSAGAGGGGGSVYYFNGNTLQRNISGIPYYQFSTLAAGGTSANFTKTGDGLLASFITDSLKPNQTILPGGVWVFSAYFKSSSTGGSPQVYAIISKWDGATLTPLDTTTNETITNGTTQDLYTLSASMGTFTLAATDRIAVQFYTTNVSSRTITLYTEDHNYASVATTFPNGIGSLNSLTTNTQNFATGTSGTDFAISSSGSTHTFNLPTASASNRGALSSADWTTFNGKGNGTVTSAGIAAGTGISVSGSPITSSGVVTVTATGSLTAGTGISIAGSFPTYTVTNTSSASGTVTSVGLIGSSTMSVTGTTSPITSSGTYSLSIPSSVPLAGSPTTTTQSAGDNSTKIATTAYVDGTYGVQYTTAANYTTSTTPTSTIASRNAPVNWVITAQAGALLFNAPTGSWADMQPLVTRIASGSSSYALTYNSAFTAGTSTPASATTANQSTLIIWLYNSSISKYQCYYSGTSN